MPETPEQEQKPLRTFASYEDVDGEWIEVARYTNRMPAGAAMKATNKWSKILGITEKIQVVIREVAHTRKDGKIMLRFYEGTVNTNIRTSPNIGTFQEDLAIKANSWVLNDNDKPAMSPFPDGYDSTDDPRLEGKRPKYVARVAKVKFIKTEPIPIGMRLSRHKDKPA
ncbi:MAG: hypothetical protein KAS32_22585 [Candidatus Peribacteraceae bacterium]|nr:hypothetical protein [Candidatus Peribacteraceae bacterium]